MNEGERHSGRGGDRGGRRGGRGGRGEERVREPDDAGPSGRRRLAGPHAENPEAAPGLAPPPDEVPAPQIIGRPSEVEPLLERAGQRAAEVERAAAQDIESFASQQLAEAEASEGFATAAEAAAGAAEAAAAAEGGGMLAALGEGALAAAGTVGAATGGLAVAGAGAALVGTAWAIEGGLNAASHLMSWGAAMGGGTDSDASRPSMTTDVQTLNGMQEQRRAQRPELFRIDTESESEPRNRPLPQIRSRPARRPRPQAQTPFGLNNVPIPVSSGSERSRVSRQSRGDRRGLSPRLRGPLGTQPSFDALRQARRTGSCIGIVKDGAGDASRPRRARRQPGLQAGYGEHQLHPKSEKRAVLSEFPEHFYAHDLAGMSHPHHVRHGFSRSRVRKVGVYLPQHGRHQRHAARLARSELFH